MEAVFSICGAGGPQLKRNPLGSVLPTLGKLHVAALDPAVFALHRYYIWANRMRTHFDDLLARQRAGEARNEIEEFLYMSYWYAGLYVVVEGWQELGLSEPTIDNLLMSPNVDLLRRYRNGVFHFQKEYYDDRFVGFIGQGVEVVRWVRDLTLHLGRYFLQLLNPQEYGSLPGS